MTVSAEQEALELVRLFGLDHIRNIQHYRAHAAHLQNANPADVDAAQTAYQTKSAADALDAVRLLGIDWVTAAPPQAQHLAYGLEHALFDQAVVDAAQKEYQIKAAKEALDTVKVCGLDWIKATNPTVAQHLIYGLEQKLFDQAAVDTADAKFKAEHGRELRSSSATHDADKKNFRR